MVSNFIDSGKKVAKALPKNIPDGLQSVKKGVNKIINLFQSNKKELEGVIDEEQKKRHNNVLKELNDTEEKNDEKPFVPIETAFDGSYRRFKINSDGKKDVDSFLKKVRTYLE